MSTGSTKSGGRKTAGEGRNKAADAPSAVTDAADLSPRLWWVACLSVIVVAAFVRLYALGLKPMHHDEGVNGFFLTTLYREGVYHYDPSNYHGPTLYYFALAVTKLKAFLFGEPGLSTIAVRLVPALFGIATVWLALRLRRHIGAVGAISAAALIALSPGDVYVSRYFIHETQFAFFALGIVVAALRYWETTDPVYLLLAAISAALLTATKETAMISLIVLGLAWAVSALFLRLTRRKPHGPWEQAVRDAAAAAARPRPQTRRAAQAERAGRLARLGGGVNVVLMSALALVLFVFVNIFFYSSFFSYWEGVEGAMDSLKIWAQTGTKEHGHDWHTYLRWLVQEEAPLLLLGAVGSVWALASRHRFAVFAGAWAFGLLAAYSLIPYKTPWLMINFTVPLAVVSGYAVNEIYQLRRDWPARLAALMILLTALAVCGVQAVRLNFFRYDDDKYPYVYAHTYREFLPLVNKIEELATRAGTGRKTGITITAPEYWPLPWYLRDYEHAGFFGRMTETQEPLVVASVDQEDELAGLLGDAYQRVDAYPLRPGVTLLLYARRDLLEQER